jgi:hypothetical protein
MKLFKTSKILFLIFFHVFGDWNLLPQVYFNQGTLTEGEASVQLTSLYYLV